MIVTVCAFSYYSSPAFSYYSSPSQAWRMEKRVQDCPALAWIFLFKVERWMWYTCLQKTAIASACFCLCGDVETTCYRPISCSRSNCFDILSRDHSRIRIWWHGRHDKWLVEHIDLIVEHQKKVDSYCWKIPINLCSKIASISYFKRYTWARCNVTSVLQ